MEHIECALCRARTIDGGRRSVWGATLRGAPGALLQAGVGEHHCVCLHLCMCVCIEIIDLQRGGETTVITPLTNASRLNSQTGPKRSIVWWHWNEDNLEIASRQWHAVSSSLKFLVFLSEYLFNTDQRYSNRSTVSTLLVCTKQTHPHTFSHT